jgi:hypothetical protein
MDVALIDVMSDLPIGLCDDSGMPPGDLVSAVRAVKRAQEKLDQARDDLHGAIVIAIRDDGWKQRDVAEVTGYSREHIRRICKDAGVEPLR